MDFVLEGSLFVRWIGPNVHNLCFVEQFSMEAEDTLFLGEGRRRRHLNEMTDEGTGVWKK
jgi:hypothetical protein